MNSSRFRFVMAASSIAAIQICGVACGKGGGSDASTGDGGTGPINVGPGPDNGSTSVGGEVPTSAGLPVLPLLGHVVATVRGNVATVSFDPYAGAKDYRVYLLPQKSDVRLNADGSFDGVNNAVYRCAGGRAAPRILVEGQAGSPNPVPDWVAVKTLADGKGVSGYTRPLAEATLGFVFQDSVADTVPVYAVGDPDVNGDNYGYGVREPQTRAKLYVTDNAALLAQGWRDDGIAFYAPASSTSKACGDAAPVLVHTIDKKEQNGTGHLFYASAGEVASRGPGTDAFYACPAQVAGALPLMRTYYDITSPGGVFGGDSGHDELSLGAERFARARCQGSDFGPCADAPQSMWEVQWSNITAPMTLVVEALDAGCTFQGLLGATSLPSLPVSIDDNNGDATLKNDQVFTFAELQAKAPHGEVYINGQYDGTSPHPIARSAVNVAPQARPPMDFASDFAGNPEQFTEVLAADGSPACGLTPALEKLAQSSEGCDTAHRMTSPTYDMLFMDVYDKRYGSGVVQGELWTAYSGGKFRFTPKDVTATMADSAFIHAAMEVSAFSTGRRYPQIVISEGDMITSQWLLERTPSGSTNPNVKPAVLLHTIDAGVGRHVLELEVCTSRQWQVNNHCPWFVLEKNDPPTLTGVGKNNPHPDLFDKLQDDRATRFDLFLSRQKAYVFLDSKPYGCVDLAHAKAIDSTGAPINPAPALPAAGPVSVTFGDVQYHAGAESGYFDNYSAYHLKKMLYETVRHFEYVGFKSNEPQPAWDEKASPCITQMYEGGNAGTQTPETGNP